MGRQQRGNQQQRAATQQGRGSGAAYASQRNTLAAKVESSLIDQLLPGRHPCRCQARKHGLIRNCMGCGKIVCTQEGSGPCFFCGTLVCTVEEREVLDRGSKKSVELRNKLMGEGNGKGISLASVGSALETATMYRNRLLEADADSENRTKVNDLESDYSTVENNPFLSPEDREAIVRRRAELRNIRAERKKAVVISLNLANNTVTEQKTNLKETDPAYDPVIQSILERSDVRRKAAEAAHTDAVDAHWLPKDFVPKYDSFNGTKFQSNIGEYLDVESMAALNEEMMKMEVERKGYAIAVPQPVAALVAHGRISVLRWHEDIHLKGPVFVSATVKSASDGEIANYLSTYAKDFPSTSSFDFSPGSIMGRVFVEDCMTYKDYEEEFGTKKLEGTGEFVLLFSSCEPFVNSIPHIPPSNFYQLDKELKNALCNVFSRG